MNTIKVTTILLISCIFVLGTLFAQNNNNEYQQLLAKTQVLFAKQPETLNKEDLAKLDELIKLDINLFGEENARLCKKLVDEAKKKKEEYNQYIERMKDMSSTLNTLDDEISKRMLAEQENADLSLENTNLKLIIEDLQSVIARFKKQEQKLNKANSRLAKENLVARELLKESADIVGQMLTLMPNFRMDNTTSEELPQTLIDSLEDAQCRVSRLLKENFLITIQQLSANDQFMDSANIYFKDKNSHLFEVRGYMQNGEELINRLRKSGIDCAIDCAKNIETEMHDFIFNIENRKHPNDNFLVFISNNVYWIVPICLILIVGIIVLVRNTSSKKSSSGNVS